LPPVLAADKALSQSDIPAPIDASHTRSSAAQTKASPERLLSDRAIRNYEIKVFVQQLAA
jgi:hypothetical protein